MVGDRDGGVDMGSVELIQSLSALKPMSLLKANVAGHGYSLVPQDLALVGNASLLGEFFSDKANAGDDDIVCGAYLLKQKSVLLTFSLYWPQYKDAYGQPGLRFGHAVVCKPPQSEASTLALSELALGLLRHYEASYVDIGTLMARVAQDPAQTNWAEAFLSLPQQLPNNFDRREYALLLNLRSVVQNANTPTPIALPQPAKGLRWFTMAGWLVAAVLAVLLVWVWRG